MRILLFGDENFSFCNGFLADHDDDIVEVCSCLKENELKQESKNNIEALNKNVIIHYGINPVQLKSKFPPNTFDALYYILPGLSFHGHPDFIHPQTEMFKLRLNLFCFSFLKSSKNIVKPDGYVYMLFPDESTCKSSIPVPVSEGNAEGTNHNNDTENNNQNSEGNDHVEGNSNLSNNANNAVGEGLGDASEGKKNILPFLPIEPKKLAKFCNVTREYSKDYNLNLDLHENWLPVLFNMPIVNELPEWVKTCKYYCFKMTELPINKNKNSRGGGSTGNNNVGSAGNMGNEQNQDNDNENKDGESGEGKEEGKNDEEKRQDGEENNDNNNSSMNNINAQNNENKGNNGENELNKEKEDNPDEYNVLKIPPQVFDYPIEKLGHVNECFLFKLYSVNSKSVLISRLTLKYDPRISGWKGDNKIKKDMLNMNMPINMSNMNMNNINNMNMMKNMNNIMNMNKFKGGKYKNKQPKNDFQQQYKNNIMQNNMNYSLNKKGNMNLPPPPPNNLTMQPNSVNITNQNINYKQSNFPFVNNFKGIPNNLSQNVQNTMPNIPMNVNPNLSNNMMNPYLNGAFNNNFRNNMYQQNIPIPPPMGNFNKKIYQGHNMNIKRKNDMYNCDTGLNFLCTYDCVCHLSVPTYLCVYLHMSTLSYMNNVNACNDDYDLDQCDYNAGNVRNMQNKNAEDADYYL
eukprot:XP_002262155.1 hypothetical protein, conserved in Plasmodium species [Plasmodium knowlesi strain H]